MSGEVMHERHTVSVGAELITAKHLQSHNALTASPERLKPRSNAAEAARQTYGVAVKQVALQPAAVVREVSTMIVDPNDMGTALESKSQTKGHFPGGGSSGNEHVPESLSL